MNFDKDEKRMDQNLEKPASQRIEAASLKSEHRGITDSHGPRDYSGAVAKTDAAEIALVRKLDWRIMPCLWAMYFMNYIDRSAITAARLNNLERDLGLVNEQYNTCVSILFVGYLIMQIPSNMLMATRRIRPSIYMCICMMAWALTSACTALTHSYTDLLLVRFFLGIAEAPFYPGALYMLSLFYTRKEIATRISILYSGNIMATSFSGLIAEATFSTLDGVHGIAGWRWLFIIEGLVTFGVAVVAIFLLADFPLTTRWLSPAERLMAFERIERDTMGSEDSKGTRAGFMQAVRDPRLYLFALMQNMHLSSCSFTNFFPTVVGTLGFNRTVTLALTCPPYLVSGVFGFLVALSSGKHNERTWHITFGMCIALIGFITSTATMNTGARYFSCFLFASGAYSVNSCILGWVSATLGQTSEKKSVSLSVVNVVANASYVYTSYLYPKSDGPKYLTAMASNAAFAFMTIATVWVMKIWLIHTNKKLKRENPAESVYYAY